MKRMQREESRLTMHRRHIGDLTLPHLTAMLASVLAMTCGTYLFNLTPEKLRAIGAANGNLTPVKLFALGVIFLGMELFLCNLLDWYEKKTSRKDEPEEQESRDAGRGL